MNSKLFRSFAPAFCLSAVVALSGFSAHANEMIQEQVEDGGSGGGGGGGGGGGSGPSHPTGQHGRSHHVTPKAPATPHQPAANSGHHAASHAVTEPSQLANDPFSGTPFDPKAPNPRKLPTRKQIADIRKTPVNANLLAQKKADALAQPRAEKPLRAPASEPAPPVRDSEQGAPSGVRDEGSQELQTQSGGSGGSRSGSSASGI